MIMASRNASHLHLHEGVMNGRDYFANFFMQPTVSAKIFDPLGFLNPFTVQLKLICM